MLAHTLTIFFCAIFALVQLGETLKFKGTVWSSDNNAHVSTDMSGFMMALSYEIALAVTIAVLTLIFGYLCKKLSQQVSYLPDHVYLPNV